MKESNIPRLAKRAVLYCRVSTKEQVEEGNSLTTQENFCKDYALKNGYEVVRVFIEQGESAKTADRTELKNMLVFCADRKNSINAVIAYKIDRISRNTDDYSQIRLLLKQHKVEIRSTSEHFENNPVGKFLENTMANIAQFDNDIRTERSVNGMKEAARSGRYVWNAPFGYTNTRIGGKATIAPVPEKARLIQKAFKEVAKELSSIESIRNKLVLEGMRVSKSHFYNLLRNEVYAGWIKKFGEKHRGLYEPLIEQTTFDHVQSILRGKKRKNYQYNVKNPDFPLRKFIYTPEGTKLTGAWSQGNTNRHAYYRFMKINRYFKKAELEEAFKQILNSYKIDISKIEQFEKETKEQYSKKVIDKAMEQKIMASRLEELYKKQDYLLDKNMTGILGDALFKDQMETVEFEITRIRHEMSTLHDITATEIDGVIGIMIEFLKNPSEIWEKAPYAQKIELQKFVFPSGICIEDMNLRTPEICSIFKVKEGILPAKSFKVPLKFSKSDGRKKYYKRQITYYYICPPNTPKTHTHEGFLQILCRDLNLLQKTILKMG